MATDPVCHENSSNRFIRLFVVSTGIAYGFVPFHPLEISYMKSSNEDSFPDLTLHFLFPLPSLVQISNKDILFSPETFSVCSRPPLPNSREMIPSFHNFLLALLGSEEEEPARAI